MGYVLHRLLSDASQRWPDRPAVVTGDTSVSYGDLEGRSNQLAHALRSAGNRRGDRVALLYRKTPEAYVGVYGIMKAGCAYVPLDSRAPPERLEYILRDCGVQTVVVSPGVQRAWAALQGRLADVRVLALSDEISGQGVVTPEQVAGETTQELGDVPVVDCDLAYILYTSGSTGRPKGVMISHRNALTFVRWAHDYVGVQRDDRVSGHAPLHFDLSIFDIYASAMAGAPLYPVPDGISAFPAQQAQWIADRGISVWYSVPSALSMMAQQKTFGSLELPAMRAVIFAGEVFPAKYLRAWKQQVPHARFMNWYGPTETNVVTAYTVEEDPTEIERPVSIGAPCENMDVFLDTEEGRIASEPGEVGEVCVRGSCVALGYWGDQEKTDRSFVPDRWQPWLRDPVYRTGDLASWDEKGRLTYLGRRDHQIKSRGYRIEIGDIEAAMSAVPEVAEVIVVPVPDELINNRLVGVVALKDGTALGEAAILEVVARSLPRYMVPERIVFRSALPKTSTGKVDRQALAQAVRT